MQNTNAMAGQTEKPRATTPYKTNRNEITSHRVRGNEENVALVNEMVGMLWSDQQLCDEFNGKKKGWQSRIAKKLSVSPHVLGKAIAHVGGEKVEKLVNRNPAGEAPVVYGRRRDLPSFTVDTACCGTTICQSTACDTGTPCGTSTCGSCYCQSGECIGMKSDMKLKLN